MNGTGGLGGDVFEFGIQEGGDGGISATSQGDDGDFLDELGFVVGAGGEKTGGRATGEADDGGVAEVGVFFVFDRFGHSEKGAFRVGRSEVSEGDGGVEFDAV